MVTCGWSTHNHPVLEFLRVNAIAVEDAAISLHYSDALGSHPVKVAGDV